MSGTETPNTSKEQDAPKPDLGPDEVYCTSCGEPIKEEAEICPECGVRQEALNDTTTAPDSGLPDARQYELQKIARKDQLTVAVVSFLLSPAGYLMIGKTGLAIINFLTLNYFLLGFIIVPIHTWRIIGAAREELERNGVSW